MIRLNRARWLHRFDTEDISGFRGPELKRWLAKHGLIEVVPSGHWTGVRVVLSQRGRLTLDKWREDAARHGIKL